MAVKREVNTFLFFFAINKKYVTLAAPKNDLNGSLIIV